MTDFEIPTAVSSSRAQGSSAARRSRSSPRSLAALRAPRSAPAPASSGPRGSRRSRSREERSLSRVLTVWCAKLRARTMEAVGEAPGRSELPMMEETPLGPFPVPHLDGERGALEELLAGTVCSVRLAGAYRFARWVARADANHPPLHPLHWG